MSKSPFSEAKYVPFLSLFPKENQGHLITTFLTLHSMTRANLNKSEKFLKNTTAASKCISFQNQKIESNSKEMNAS